MKLSITVKTRAKQEKIEKTDGGCGYTVHVKEPPVENKANSAIIKLLSKYFRVPKSQITILSGMQSKRRIIEIKNQSQQGKR